jgi:hypothetical protein
MVPVAITALILVDEGEPMLEEPPPPHATAQAATAAATRNPLIFNITSPIADRRRGQLALAPGAKALYPNCERMPSHVGHIAMNGIDSNNRPSRFGHAAVAPTVRRRIFAVMLAPRTPPTITVAALMVAELET